MELWDVYDINRQKLNYKLARCTEAQLPPDCEYRAAVAPSGKLQLQPDEFHLSVHVWFINRKGELLIQKRAENKLHMPGVWAACGGAVMAGETTLDAAVRESYEEMGIVINPEKLTKLLTYTAPERNSHMDVYIYRYECDPEDLTLQVEEVARAGWFPLEALMGKTFTDEQFRRYTYMDVLYEFIISQSDWQRVGFIDPGVRRREQELIDVYNIDGKPTGLTMNRGAAQPYGDYFMAVHVWFIGPDGRALLQRRSMQCAFKPGYYAPTGGVAKAGETRLEAAKREVAEELGLKLDESRLFRLCEYVGEYYICTVYASTQQVEPHELRLQKEEVASVEFINPDMLSAYRESENFVGYPYMPMVIGAMRAMERHRLAGR